MVGRSRKASTRHRRRPHPLAQAVGERIRALRLEQEFTFDAFVEESGLGRGYISELERGLVVPTILALSKVATAMELTLADLVAAGKTPREELIEIARRLSPAGQEQVLSLARALLNTESTDATKK